THVGAQHEEEEEKEHDVDHGDEIRIRIFRNRCLFSHAAFSLRSADYRAPPASFWASGDRFRDRISPIWLLTRSMMSLTLFFMKKKADRNTIEMNRPIVVFTSDSYTPFARSPGVGAFRFSMTWKEEIMPVTVPSRPSRGPMFPTRDR